MVAEWQEAEDPAGEDLLPATDLADLRHRGLRFRAEPDAGFVNLVVLDYPLPGGFDHPTADLLIRLPSPGWPDVRADMWWFDPWLRIARTGAYPQAADQPQVAADRNWQRWSRHFPDADWKPGIDGIGSYLALVDQELKKTVA